MMGENKKGWPRYLNLYVLWRMSAIFAGVVIREADQRADWLASGVPILMPVPNLNGLTASNFAQDESVVLNHLLVSNYNTH